MSNDQDVKMLFPLYLNGYSDEACHPWAPSGGGGCGAFMQAGPLGCSYDYLNLPHPAAPAARSLTAEKITVATKSEGFNLSRIPGIMRNNNWPKGAALMESWFSRKAKTAPDYDAPDTSTIKMSWVLGFERAAEVYDKLVKEQIWHNQAAQKQIASMLKSKGLLTPMPNMCFSRPFGDLSLPVEQQDQDYINQRALGMSSDLDDLNAALANFVFNILVSGHVNSDEKPGVFKVEITKVGIYMKDSYDFNGDQFLGYWDSNDNSVSMFNPFSGSSVSNKDFRDWRTRNNKGGDFRVFSDINIIPRNPPDTFYIK